MEVALLFLHDDRRIQIRIQSRIREAQKHVDPVDPDPQHWLAELRTVTIFTVPVPTFYQLLFWFRLLTSYGSSSG